MSPPAEARERGGPLSCFSVAVYGLLAPTVCFVAASAPYLAAALLARTPLPIAVTGTTIGPAWIAALATARAYATSRDIEPVRLYWHHWRQSALQGFLFWTPFSLLLAMLAGDVLSGRATGGAGSVATILLAAVALLWGNTVLLVIAFFSFRLRDAMRIALWGLIRSPRWLVADAALLVVVLGAVLTGGEPLAGLLVMPIALLTVRNARGLLDRVRREFTVEGRAEGAASSG